MKLTFVASDGGERVVDAIDVTTKIAAEAMTVATALETCGRSSTLTVMLPSGSTTRVADAIVQHAVETDPKAATEYIRSLDIDTAALVLDTAVFLDHDTLVRDVVDAFALRIDPMLLASPRRRWQEYTIVTDTDDTPLRTSTDAATLCEVVHDITAAWAERAKYQGTVVSTKAENATAQELRTALEDDAAPEVVEAIINKFKEGKRDLNFAYDDNETPLRLALYNARLETVTLLLEQGARAFWGATHKKPLQTSIDLLTAAITAVRCGKAAERFPLETDDDHASKIDAMAALFGAILMNATIADAPIIAEALATKIKDQDESSLAGSMIARDVLVWFLAATQTGRFTFPLDVIAQVHQLYSTNGHDDEESQMESQIIESLVARAVARRNVMLQRLQELSLLLRPDLLWRVAKRVGFSNNVQ
jgi:hypothetical protein